MPTIQSSPCECLTVYNFYISILFCVLMCTCIYKCEMIFAIFCLHFIHIDIGYECIVLSCTIEINILFLQVEMSFTDQPFMEVPLEKDMMLPVTLEGKENTTKTVTEDNARRSSQADKEEEDSNSSSSDSD